jgi:hypothetical protein
LLLPISGPDLEAASQMAETALADTRSNVPVIHVLWMRSTKALAEYRQGHYASAIDWANQAAPEANGGQSDLRFVEAHSVMAMAHFRMNDSAAARKELARSTRVLEKAPGIDSETLFTGGVMGFADWLIAHCLFREAQALIEGDAKAAEGAPRS